MPIVGFQPTRTVQDVIAAFEKSQFQFYLTGSRYFGNNHYQSDWDFFVQREEENYNLVNFLTELGFNKATGTVYKEDSNTADVYKLAVGEGIHVQVVYDAVGKNTIQQAFKDTGIRPDKTLWNLAYKLLLRLRDSSPNGG